MKASAPTSGHQLPAGSGGDFYPTPGARVGQRFAHAVVASTLEGRSSFTEAFRLLGLKKMSTLRSDRVLSLEL